MVVHTTDESWLRGRTPALRSPSRLEGPKECAEKIRTRLFLEWDKLEIISESAEEIVKDTGGIGISDSLGSLSFQHPSFLRLFVKKDLPSYPGDDVPVVRLVQA